MSATQPSFATPIPAGLGALAVACFAFGAVYLEKVTLAGYPLLAAWLIGGGIVQIVTGLIELKDKNVTAGNVFLFFSAFFMFSAALSVFAKFVMVFLVKNGMFSELLDLKTYKVVEGYCWIGGALFITVIIPSYIKAAPRPLTLMIILLTVCLWLIAGLDLQLIEDPNKFWHHCVGYLVITSGLIAIYIVGAVCNNSVFGKELIPLFVPSIKK